MAVHANNCFWLLVPPILTAIKTILSLFLESISLLLFLPLLSQRPKLLVTAESASPLLPSYGQNNLVLPPKFVSPPSKIKALHLIESILFLSSMACGELGNSPSHSTVSSRIPAQCIFLCSRQVYKTYLLSNWTKELVATLVPSWLP